MRITPAPTTASGNPFLADVQKRMRLGLRSSSADDALAQLLGPSYDHPATQLREEIPARPTPLFAPIVRITPLKAIESRRNVQPEKVDARTEEFTRSVFATQVRGTVLDEKV